MTSPRLSRPHIEAFILALSLQAAVSLGFVGIDTQVAASQIVLPYFVAAAALAWLAGGRFPITIGWGWVIGFFSLALVLMLHGLYVGTQHAGIVSGWGVRRVVSTVLMFGYFLAGLYLSSHSARVRDEFAIFFIAAAGCAAVLSLLAHFAAQYFGFGGQDWLFLSEAAYRPQGLMNSPVPFSWLLLSALAFQVAFQTRLQKAWPRLNIACLAVLLAALVVSGTKAAWVGAVVAGPVVYAISSPRPRLQPLGAALLIALGLIGTAVLFHADGEKQAFLGKMASQDMLLPESLSVREGQLTLALELIREHPVRGVGLGSYTWEEARHGLPVQHYLHNSILWLWTELGPAAVLLFIAFFARVIHALWPTRPENRGEPFQLAVFALLCAFAAISVVDDVLYQRYMWVFVGAALAVPACRRTGDNGKTA